MSRCHRLTMSLGLLASACAHAPAQAGSSQAACPEPASHQREPVALYDLVFRMRIDEGAKGPDAKGPDADARASWSSLPDALHALTLGPWECALGPLQASDSFATDRASLERVRRLACTDKTGATIQTELRCGVSLPLAPAALANARRELVLTLSGAPQARFACEPELREQLHLAPVSAAPRVALCLTEARIHACDAPSPPVDASTP